MPASTFSRISTPAVRYKLNETVGPTAVEQMHALNGTYTSIPTFAVGPITKYAIRSPIFDGDAYVTCPDDANTRLTTSTITIECLFNFKPTNSLLQPIVGKWFSTGNQKSYRVGIDFATKKVQIDFSADGVTTTSTNLSPTTNIIFGHTYFLTISKRSGVVTFFCNGVDLGTVTNVLGGGTAFANTAESLYIGRWHQTAGEGGDLFCKGTISDVRIYKESSTLATHTLRYKEVFGDIYRHPTDITPWV